MAVVEVGAGEEHDDEERDVDEVGEELTIARLASHARAVMGLAIPDLPTMRTAQFWQTVLDLASDGVTGAAIALHITCLADNRALPTPTTPGPAQPSTHTADTGTTTAPAPVGVADPHRARDAGAGAGAELTATQEAAPAAAPAAAPHNHGIEPGGTDAAPGSAALEYYLERRHRRSVRIAEWFNCLASEEQKAPVVTVRQGTYFEPWVVRVDLEPGTATGTAPTRKDAKKMALVRHFIDPAFDPDRAGSPSPDDMRWPAAHGRRRALEAARKKERNAALWARAGEPPPPPGELRPRGRSRRRRRRWSRLLLPSWKTAAEAAAGAALWATSGFRRRRRRKTAAASRARLD